MRLHRRIPMTLALGAILTAVALFEPGTRPASAGGGGCHGAPQTEGAGNEVNMVHGCFEPTVLRTERGTTVTFTNSDPTMHIVNGQTWGLPGDIRHGASLGVSFEEDGTYPYACAYHPGMVGVIVVGDGITDAPSTNGGVQTSKVAYADAGNDVTVGQPDQAVAESSGDEPRTTVLWSAAALLTGAVSAGAAGLWLGKRRRPR